MTPPPGAITPYAIAGLGFVLPLAMAAVAS